MDPLIRRAALRATAKVALGSAWSMLIACGGRSGEPEERGKAENEGLTELAGLPEPERIALAPTVAQRDAGAEAVDAREAADDSRPGDACVGAQSLDALRSGAKTVGDEQLRCCADHVLEWLEAKPSAVPNGGSSVYDCCAAIVFLSDPGSPHYATRVRDFCCFAEVVAPREELFPTAFCTPWGPPVPPAMPNERTNVA